MSDRPPAALSGLRVLDLAGPMGWYTAKLFADLGADVLRIESPAGDPGRQLAPFGPDGESLTYSHFNTSKRAQSLDLTTVRGRDEFLDLARQADIVIETGQPGHCDRLGIGYQQIVRENPGLIWTAITPFGQSGPKSGWRGSDLIGLAAAGPLQLAGNPGSPPSQGAGDLAFHQAGVVAATGTLVALVERDRSGLGQFVDISVQEALLVANENNFALWDSMGVMRRRIGTKSFSGFVQVYQCRDGWMIGWLGRRWDHILGWLEENKQVPAHWRQPEWQDEAYRFAHSREIDAVMHRLTSGLTREQIYQQSQQRRIANGPVARVDELFRDPQLLGREFWLETEPAAAQESKSGSAARRTAGAPYKLNQTPWRISRPAPLPGQHNGQGWSSAEAHDWGRRAVAHTPAPPLPLSHLRVIDFTWQIAGPLTTQVLADHGAEVLKVESVIHPDGLRQMLVPRPPWTDSPNQSGIFNMFNTSKRSVSLDLRTDGGIALLKQLIHLADVTVDNYGVDPFGKWGLTPAAMREINPDLIVARSSVMGRSGPRQHFIGFGYSISAAAGLNSHTGFPGDPPVGVCTAHPDYSCNPFHLLVAILSSLYYRNRTGVGQRIDLSQHESTVIFNGPALLDHGVNGVVPAPRANRDRQRAPHGAYPARGEDRWVAIVCVTDKDWTNLARTIERADLIEDPRFATMALRKQHEDALDREISAWTRLRTAHDAAAILQEAGIAAHAVQTMPDLIRDPHLKARRQLVRQDHPELGHTQLSQPGFHLSRTPGTIRRHPVLLGQDTDDILRELLALDEEEIAMGYVEGVLQ